MCDEKCSGVALVLNEPRSRGAGPGGGTLRWLNYGVDYDSSDVWRWSMGIDTRFVKLHLPSPSGLTVTGLRRPFWIRRTHTGRL